MRHLTRKYIPTLMHMRQAQLVTLDHSVYKLIASEIVRWNIALRNKQVLQYVLS